jgi:membrane protein
MRRLREHALQLVMKMPRLIACAFRQWFADGASTMGAALAFYCAFSLAPLLIITVTLTGWVVGRNSAFDFLGTQLALLFGSATAAVLLDAMADSLNTEGLMATLLSVGTLLIGATTALNVFEEALERIWGTTPQQHGGISSWLRRRVLSFAFLLTLSFLLLVSLTLSTAIAGLRSWTAERYAPLLGVIGGLDFLVSLALTTSLFGLIYRYIPRHRLPWNVVMVGGLLTALLFSLGKWLVGLYLARSAVPSAFGAAASFAALLLWLYYTAQIFLFGAEFTACLGGVQERRAKHVR